MSKTKAKVAQMSEVVVEYDLFDLPTAQHKAGLAGLLLQLRSMAERNKPEDCIPKAEWTATRATIRFTEKSVKSLFDDLYAAKPGRVEVKSPWKGAKLIEERTDEEMDAETKQLKKVKRFVYEVVQPCGHFLRDRYPDEDGAWLKLWRDMLWAIPRGIPKTRKPFEDCAERGTCDVGEAIWSDLLKFETKRQRGELHVNDVVGSLWLGAQAFNAEAVPFQGRAEQNLLLHFWPLAVLIFVPQQIDSDGASEFVGYALAIPEVADLENFCEDYRQMLRDLSDKVRGFRPAEAVVDLPAEGALAFLEHLARLTEQMTRKGQLRYAVSSVEFMHLVKVGNNVKSMAAGRVAADERLLRGYRDIVGRAGEGPPFRNPFFRRGLLLALLKNRDWYQEMGPILVTRPWPFFVRSDDTPTTVYWFSQDARKKFQALKKAHQESIERYRSMAEFDPTAVNTHPATPPELLIERIVRKYVTDRAKVRCGYPKEQKLKDLPEDKRKQVYDEKRKVAADAFLAIRSRRDQDFVAYFTEVLCSMGHYSDKKQHEFQVLAAVLTDSKQRDDLKALTLLALSANS